MVMLLLLLLLLLMLLLLLLLLLLMLPVWWRLARPACEPPDQRDVVWVDQAGIEQQDVLSNRGSTIDGAPSSL